MSAFWVSSVSGSSVDGRGSSVGLAVEDTRLVGLESGLSSSPL